jgi:hypothetical protein
MSISDELQRVPPALIMLRTDPSLRGADDTVVKSVTTEIHAALWLLLIVAGCGAWSTGYNSGRLNRRAFFSQIVFPVLIGIVITLNSDIDRPRMGLIGLSRKPMEELLEGMQPAPR